MTSPAKDGHGAPPRDGNNKRERILDAAVKVFADKGFYNAKVSEIAREAGVADGTIYLYFKSKDDLLISLFEARMAEVNENLRAALASAADPIAKLRAAVRRHLGLVEQHPHVAEVLTVELRQSAKFMKEYSNPIFGEFLKLIASTIEEGQRSGALRRDLDPPIIARALFGALDELALAWLLKRRGAPGRRMEGLELSHAADHLANFFIDGLRQPDSASPPTNRSGGGPASRRTP
ncbi:MAG TPA: TetR/AcrR family transcriptional regulator [Polyangia bacterium]|nr:TetR/AcrR family transcriptional regulator [Polyangia bacterium]